MEPEKMTVNVTPVDLGRIDVLVSQGYYTSRSDFVRTAIRRLLSSQEDAVSETVIRERFNVGVHVLTAGDLRQRVDEGERLQLRVVGLVLFGPGVTADLADRAVESIAVRGAIRGPRDVLDRLADRIERSPAR